MNWCCIGNLRLLLEGIPVDNDGLLHETLYKVQRSLISSSLLHESDDKLQQEVQDCALAKGGDNLFLRDLEGLASNLVVLLASHNSFTKHSAGKTLMALFSFLHGSVSHWTFLLNFLWNTLKGCFGGDDGYIKLVLLKECVGSSHLSLKHAFRIAMHLIQISHDLLRKVKFEGTRNLENFLACSVAHISEVLAAFSTRFKCLANNSSVGQPEVDDDLILAALLRFLCSFMHSMCMHTNTINVARIFSENQILNSLIGFLEAFAQYCLNFNHSGHLPYYLRHKFLMLMFRMHDWFIEWPSLALACSVILRSNITSLCPSLFVEQASPSAPSLLSPFAACVAESKKHPSPLLSVCQPEKHAVFLIFKLELSMVRTSLSSSMRSTEGNIPILEDQEVQWMYNWLLAQISLPGHRRSYGTAALANHLTSSFLQIFIDEDTSVLEILVLLQDYSIPDLFPGSSDHDSPQRAHELLMEVFKPIRLFAVFLSLISYDHLVIIDFLIAKDTSVLCLKYLLRSMHLVRNTWPELLSLSADTGTSRITRRESFHKLSNQDVKQFHSSAVYAVKPLVHVKPIDINRVGTCLVELRRAIEKLHEKHAFPYNPSPFLKHLDFFEHLWSPIQSNLR